MSSLQDRARAFIDRDPIFAGEVARQVAANAEAPRPTYSLTRRLRDLFDFIDVTVNESGFAPSLDEMCEHMDLRSKSGVHRMLVVLEERGCIRRLPGRARAIQVLV